MPRPADRRTGHGGRSPPPGPRGPGPRRAPVDPDVAVLLTSDLVTNAIRHQPGGTITLGVRCVAGQLRVDVHGSAIGPDLILVQTLSDDWGCYPTPAGQAVYFTLAFSSDGREA